MPKILVNIDALPLEAPRLDESIPYHVVVRKFEMAPDRDKNEQLFCKGEYEILEPAQYRGKRIFDNYIPICSDPNANMAEVLHQAVVCFKAPYDAEGFDPSDFVGREGDVQAKNEMYNGRPTPRVSLYLAA